MRTTHLPQLPSPVAAHGASCGRPRRYCIPAIVHGPWAAATLRRRGGSLLSSPGDFATAAVAATDEKEEDEEKAAVVKVRALFGAQRLLMLEAGSLLYRKELKPPPPVSDIHLGTAGCQAEAFLAFLKAFSFDTLYLVGDVVDGWELSAGRVHWPQSHSDVLQKLLKRARKGCRIVYTPGNHDEALRDFIQDRVLELGENVSIVQECTHTTASGKRFLVLHGDRCDLTPHVRTDLNYALKSLIYRGYQAFNRMIKSTRKIFGLPYWSLATTVNSKLGAAARLIRNYEEALAGEARYQGMDGVICGHIHCAQMRDIDGVTYVNTGDWVDSLTGVVEHLDGSLEIIRWLELKARLPTIAEPVFKEPKSAIIGEFLESSSR